MNSVSSERVVIFSKSADVGTVKTRMRPVLSAEKCLSLHLALLKDTLEKVHGFSSILYLTGSGNLPFDPGVPVRLQSGDDLGERMIHAFETEFHQHSKIVIIGTDSPTFPAEQISRAFDALGRYDIALGPCEDGGYYLVGLRILVPEMFRGIQWGTSEVLKKTMEKISARSHAMLDCYFDVDVPQDLITLQKELANRMDLKNLREWISDHFGASAR